MIRREPSDDHALVGARLDWLSVAFRIRFPMMQIENLAERAKYAKKHGRAPLDFAGDLWDMAPPKVGIYFLESARGERLELAPNAPGSFVEGEGEVIPGWSLALHASGSTLAVRGGRGALERGWQIARRAGGEVFAMRMRRLDVTTDFRGALVDAFEEDDFLRNENAAGSRELDTPKGPKDVWCTPRPGIVRAIPTPASAGSDRGGNRGRRGGRGAPPLYGFDAQLGLLPGHAANGHHVRSRR